jgi:hypothetical protein
VLEGIARGVAAADRQALAVHVAVVEQHHPRPWRQASSQAAQELAPPPAREVREPETGDRGGEAPRRVQDGQAPARKILAIQVVSVQVVAVQVCAIQVLAVQVVAVQVPSGQVLEAERVGDREGDSSGRVRLAPRDLQHLTADVGGQHRAGGGGEALGPVAGAAGDLQHVGAGDERADSLAERGEIGAPLGTLVDPLVLGRPPGVIGRQLALAHLLAAHGHPLPASRLSSPVASNQPITRHPRRRAHQPARQAAMPAAHAQSPRVQPRGS